MKRSTLCFVLVTVLAIPVVAGAAARAQSSALDEACAVALDRCFTNCDGRSDSVQATQCRIGCENSAATCLPDEVPTLSSEEYLAFQGQSPLFTKAAACHDTTPCPTEYGSCGTWSSFTDCGDEFCGPSFACKRCDEWGQCTAAGPALKQRRERYRVCFNQQMEGCTEYQWTTTTYDCGC